MPVDRPYCACATPPGTSGIAVIRMAGLGSAELMDRVFTIRRTFGEAKKVSQMPGYTVAYGVLSDPEDGHKIDEVVCTRFTAPHSYTGEDSIEISCHGGIAVQQEILRVLIRNGARPAEPGEFTKNAFLAGKIDLSQAEAVMDVISAESALALSSAEIQLAGALKNRIREISSDLYTSFAALEMLVEFPEHEDTPQNVNALRMKMQDSLLAMNHLQSSYSQGRILRNGMGVVLGGVPNSGKSSLFNRLTGYDRAIVTSQPGTTRDTLEVYTSVEGVPIRLEDTAGIRETKDEIEQIGVSRAQKALMESDLLLWLCAPDGRDIEFQSEFHVALSEIQNPSSVGILISMSDLMTDEAAEQRKVSLKKSVEEWGLSDRIAFYLTISSESGQGIDQLGAKLRSYYEAKGQGRSAELVLTNERHYLAIQKAGESLSQAIEVLGDGQYADLSCSLLRGAMEMLAEVTGDAVSDELVQTIFSRFCVGK